MREVGGGSPMEPAGTGHQGHHTSDTSCVDFNYSVGILYTPCLHESNKL